MKVFNLAEELEKERKKNRELKTELKEANESITWWTNRYKAAERNNKELEEQIDKLEQLIECLYLKVELNDEQEDLLNSILFEKVGSDNNDK